MNLSRARGRRFLRWIERWTILSTVVLSGSGCSDSPPAATTRPTGSRGGSSKATAADSRGSQPAVSRPRLADLADLPPQPVYRDSDDRPRHDDEKLVAVGIRRYESPHLRLYTDIDPELAGPLPPLMDAAYAAWEAYFGPLPPDREGAVFQMTGYLMADQALFREAGLLPEDLPAFPHGRNRGRTFWMHDQSDDYYRRHLMLHEGTHCFMTAVPNALRQQLWYMEGMAELFGTHRIDVDGQPRFRVLPHDRDAFRGLGRIRLINDEVRAGRLRPAPEVDALRANDFLKNEAYAWVWALCEFLDSHPRYRERFRALSCEAAGGALSESWDARFHSDREELEEEWLLFAAHLCHGYDTDRAAIDFRQGAPLSPGASASVEIAADRGWQSSGVLVEQDKSYHVTATGRFVIANAAGEEASSGGSGARVEGLNDEERLRRPWESEPQGISFRYYDGKPLGMLVGTIRATPRPQAPPQTTMFEVMSLGPDAKLTASASGTLYLRLNDSWSELADNSGKVDVRIQDVPQNASAAP